VLGKHVAALRESRSATAAAAQAALAGMPSAAAREDVSATLALLEAAPRARPAERG
jgi:hypothetical protein